MAAKAVLPGVVRRFDSINLAMVNIVIQHGYPIRLIIHHVMHHHHSARPRVAQLNSFSITNQIN